MNFNLLMLLLWLGVGVLAALLANKFAPPLVGWAIDVILGLFGAIIGGVAIYYLRIGLRPDLILPISILTAYFGAGLMLIFARLLPKLIPERRSVLPK